MNTANKLFALVVSAAILPLVPAAAQQPNLPRDSAFTPRIDGGQRPGTPAPQRAASQPIQATVHSSQLSLPQMTGYCPFDEANHSYDREFSDGFRGNLGAELQLVRYTQECGGLTRARTNVLPALDSIAYMTTTAPTGGWAQGSRRDAATFTCNNMRNATGGERLSSTGAGPRGQEAQSIVASRPDKVEFVLLQEPTACYSFSYTNSTKADEIFPQFMQIQIFTRVRGRLIIT
ncbi:MAG: hypothetical protein RL291_1031, partial [Pseudomonadota bacterium]